MSIDTKLAKLQTQLSAEHHRFIDAARAAVAETLAEFGLTLEQIATPAKPAKVVKAPAKVVKAVAKKKTRKPPFKGPQPPKYKDPESGNTWSGFGHAPAWIATAKDRTKYLINGAA